MAAKKFVRLANGDLAEAAGVVTSAGAGNDGDIPALDATGRLDTSLMPVGIGADTKTIVTSEAVASGDFINIYNNGGTPTCRKADASNGRRAHGYVQTGVASAANAVVYFEGPNTAAGSGLTAGDVWLSAATAGKATNTPPSTAGQISQIIGTAVSATEVNFEPQRPVTIA